MSEILTPEYIPGIDKKVYMIRVYAHHTTNGVHDNQLVAPAYTERETAEAYLKWSEEKYPNLFYKQEVEEIDLI